MWHPSCKQKIGISLGLTVIALTALGEIGEHSDPTGRTVDVTPAGGPAPVIQKIDPSTAQPTPAPASSEVVDRACIGALVDLASNGVRMITKEEQPLVECAAYHWPQVLMAFSDAVDAQCLLAVADGSVRHPWNRSCSGLRDAHVRALINAAATSASSIAPPAQPRT